MYPRNSLYNLDILFVYNLDLGNLLKIFNFNLKYQGHLKSYQRSNIVTLWETSLTLYIKSLHSEYSNYLIVFPSIDNSINMWKAIFFHTLTLPDVKQALALASLAQFYCILWNYGNWGTLLTLGIYTLRIWWFTVSLIKIFIKYILVS